MSRRFPASCLASAREKGLLIRGLLISLRSALTFYHAVLIRNKINAFFQIAVLTSTCPLIPVIPLFPLLAPGGCKQQVGYPPATLRCGGSQLKGSPMRGWGIPSTQKPGSKVPTALMPVSNTKVVDGCFGTPHHWYLPPLTLKMACIWLNGAMKSEILNSVYCQASHQYPGITNGGYGNRGIAIDIFTTILPFPAPGYWGLRSAASFQRTPRFAFHGGYVEKGEFRW